MLKLSVCEAGGNNVCWIGSNNNVASWTDGSSPSGFTDWQSPAPRAQYPYVLLWFGGWAGASESWTQYPLCNAIPASTTTEPTTSNPTTSTPSNNPTPDPTQEPTAPVSTAYFRGPDLLSWNDAEAYCQSQGSNLASIHDAAENAAAFSVCEAGGNNVCWIGSNNNVASWTDGSSPSGFTDWQSPAPRAQYPYVLLWYGGWAGGSEEWTQYPLCNAIPESTTAEPTTSNPTTSNPTTTNPTTSNPTNVPTPDPTQEPTTP